MRICITGCAGHIGSALLNALPDEYDILAIDNMSSNHHAVLFKKNLRRPIHFVQADILDADLPALFSGQDVVIHLAAITDAAHSHIRKEEVETVNYIGTQKVADACIKAGCKLIFPSTTSIYGKSDGVVDETCKELRPQTPYAWSKLNAENYLCQSLLREFIILRMGTIYGMTMGGRVHTFVNQACWNAAISKSIEVWSTALNQQRPYTWIEDAMSAFRHVIDCNLFNREIYNVVTGNHTVNEIVSLIKIHRPNLSVRMVDSELQNQLSYTVSADKFIKTGWTPRGNMSIGIAQEMGWLSCII